MRSVTDAPDLQNLTSPEALYCPAASTPSLHFQGLARSFKGNFRDSLKSCMSCYEVPGSIACVALPLWILWGIRITVMHGRLPWPGWSMWG
jgi:hypothetical protein